VITITQSLCITAAVVTEGGDDGVNTVDSIHQENVVFTFFVLFVLLLLFLRKKSKNQKSTDCFSKANPSTFQYFFHAFPFFSILF
jgi:hypothetical protein